MVRSGPTLPLQVCVYDITALLLLSLPACLLLPAALAAGGMAFQPYICQVPQLQQVARVVQQHTQIQMMGEEEESRVGGGLWLQVN